LPNHLPQPLYLFLNHFEENRKVFNNHSAFRIPHSALFTLHSALCILHFAFCILHFALCICEKRKAFISNKYRDKDKTNLCGTTLIVGKPTAYPILLGFVL